MIEKSKAPNGEFFAAYKDLDGEICRGCGGAKRALYSFCYKCFSRLPKGIKLDLYKRATYPEIYQKALRFLGVI
jgi:hypothetical protein